MLRLYVMHVETDYQNGSKTPVYKSYFRRTIREKFKSEWNLDVTPAEALHVIMSQRPGMRQYLAERKQAGMKSCCYASRRW